MGVPNIHETGVQSQARMKQKPSVVTRACTPASEQQNEDRESRIMLDYSKLKVWCMGPASKNK